MGGGITHFTNADFFVSMMPPSGYTFYDAMAPQLHERGVIVEPDSREPWFVCAAHDEACLAETLVAFEESVDVTIEALSKGAS